MQKKLYILRHAKTEPGHAHQDDHSRRLVERGVEAAQITGAYLYRQGVKPAKILCSDAVRTHETWAQIETIYPAPLNVEFTRKLYMASANEILGILARLPSQIDSVMVIGHNPGMHQLAIKLAKEGDEELLDLLHLKYPTCALTSLSFGDVSWEEIAQDGHGRLEDFVTPKMLAGIDDDM